MKTKIIPLALAIGLTGMASSMLNAQEGGPPANGPASFRAHVLPPGARERLSLTADQEKQVAALEMEVKAKLEAILTPAQIQQLQQMRPPRRGGGPGGPDGGDRPPPPPGD